MQESGVQVTRTAGGDVTFAEGTAAAASASTGAGAGTVSKAGAEKMKKPTWCGEYAVGMDAFKAGVVSSRPHALSPL
jgi:hypothetical protein